MEVKYIKLFVDNLDALESLSDAQRGKLFTAILRYGRDREEPQLKGAARILFPMFKAQIDREIVGMEQTKKMRKEYGRMGGRPKNRVGSEEADGFENNLEVSEKADGFENNLEVSEKADGFENNLMVFEKSKKSIENREQKIEDRESNTENRVSSIENRVSEDRESNTEDREFATISSPEPAAPESSHTPAADQQKTILSLGEFHWVKLSQEQYQSLLQEMGEVELERVIAYVDTLAQQTENRYGWKDWFVVVRRAFRDGWGRKKSAERSPRKNAGVEAPARETSYDLEEIERLISGRRGK